MKWFSLLLSVFLVFNQSGALRVICYYRSWTSYNGYNPEDFNANLCTHVNYAFIGLKEDGNLKVDDDALDINQGLYNRVTEMKSRNADLKVLLSVGGGSAGTADLFASMAADPAKRGAFRGSADYFISTYNFDGLDIDWELPAASDKANFVTLLNELRSDFNDRGWLLTAAVSAEPGEGYDVTQFNQLFDFINVMTYDFYGPWSQYTGQNSALYPSSVESDYERNNLNLAAGIRQWLNAGMNADKLAAGLAFYGRSFTLADPNQHGLHAPITGNGVGTEGALNYNEICQSYADWTRVWDDEQKNPYKYQGNQWFGYDDTDSICEKYTKNNNLGGLMIWAIDSDDVHGVCGETQQLLKTVNNCLK